MMSKFDEDGFFGNRMKLIEGKDRPAAIEGEAEEEEENDGDNDFGYSDFFKSMRNFEKKFFKPFGLGRR